MALSFQVTTDEKILQQYHQLRYQSYHEDKHMEGHFNAGMPDEFDTCSEVVVAMEDGEVIGGARLTVRTPESPMLLPSESRELQYTDIFPDLEKKNATYGEIHRFVLRKDKRNKHTLLGLMFHCCKRIFEQDWDFFFTPSIPVKARTYKICCAQIGVNLEIIPDFVLQHEKYNNVEMQLTKCDVKHQVLYQRLKERKPHVWPWPETVLSTVLLATG